VPTLCDLFGFEHAADAADRGIEPRRNLAVRLLQHLRARLGAIEFVGQPRAIDAEGVNAGRVPFDLAIRLAPVLDRRFQGIADNRMVAVSIRLISLRTGFGSAPIEVPHSRAEVAKGPTQQTFRAISRSRFELRARAAASRGGTYAPPCCRAGAGALGLAECRC
jgi:hypothetical protein